MVTKGRRVILWAIIIVLTMVSFHASMWGLRHQVQPIVLERASYKIENKMHTKLKTSLTQDKKEDNNYYDPDSHQKNSHNWLAGKRLSNIQDISDEVATSLIINAGNRASASLVISNTSISHDIRDATVMHHILSQSICPAHSKFLRWQEQEFQAVDSVVVSESLVIRLMYLALHRHQHEPARAEAIARQYISKRSMKDTEMNIFNDEEGQVGNFDYECNAGTKYLVTSMPSGRGFGMNFRSYGVEPLMLGLVTDRVTLLMNSIKVGPREFHNQFNYAGCDRQDMQCMFMPLSPCVLTHEDIANAVQLPEEELRNLRKSGILNETYADKKVLLVHTNNMQVQTRGIVDAFMDKIANLPDSLHLDEAVLSKVREFLIDPRNKWHTWAAAGLYGLRPNNFLRDKLNVMASRNIPKDFDPKRSIGVPIRGEYYYS